MTPAPTPQPRIAALDLARTLAVMGMVVFHFTFDLQMFGHIAPGTIQLPFWYYFARLVAGSFLFLAGVSLWLAHGRGIRWPAFWRRLLMVAGGAALVSIASIWVTPGGFIWFGILHAIAIASLIGLVFLRLPALVTLAAATLAFTLPWIATDARFDSLWLIWLGLAETRPFMADYVPLLPWLAPFLAGIALGRIGSKSGLWARLTRATGPTFRTLTFPGRHSLVIYLLHQPLLVGGFFAYAWISR
ncbi:MAG: heparan-alpha-glucosaminide N-acetyltransferase [Tabrizicola sp.]|uniref:heparan-alpha-glucosaminide N-acetyltransferase n=1 Tax=Tabrizicola sp. TaxID=2005166 RepID=UPI0027351E10|nr:heparan-alpha-glucosaminide N-acetyltransferase [Tabrizicola sp.]MDP3262281.1 heparan-alpha-glucosaminide N-acetyltransferase [Tabrizicola sp.]MDP3647972.1 heparan-alpha-glucosaminide N-acetyltransferase [Paracoccaceae bacterium]MDZ4068977.1 heparan-alpha-glucosaminide N-acetyltransferase [Tabrizicola sp.]